MKFLVVGLGSMGKRRVRCLQALGYTEIVGYDPRKDRQLESHSKYSIELINSLDQVELSEFDAFIISTPPDKHLQYAKLAIDNNKPAFIEASVLLDEVKAIKTHNKKGVFMAPSCTLRFHPMIKDLTSIIKSAKYGKVTNFTYHSGQYLPDWHPWEKVNDFYVSNRITGGACEIVPFELTWIVDTIGWPNEVKGVFGKTIDFGASIEDTYAFILKYSDKIGSVMVDVASRYATRNLIVNLEKAQIQWRWDDAFFRIYESGVNRWITVNQPEFSSSTGYNKNIGEAMYVDEIDSFVKGIESAIYFPNSIDSDIKVLELLNKIENYEIAGLA